MVDSRRLGRYGVWVSVREVTPELAATAERVGFGTLWVGSAPGDDMHGLDPLFEATSTLVVATGIVNIWQADPEATARGFHRLQEAHGDRFLLGIGTGHREATQEYRKPFEAISEFVAATKAAGVPADGLVLAALGPRVMRLARDETSGAHPYLVTPEHTAQAREILGAGPLLAPEQKVVLDTDAARARDLGRSRVDDPYLHLENYLNNLRRLGWSEADIASPGSDRLIDALVAHGDDATVRAGLDAHLDAGADHVAAQVLTGPGGDLAADYERLAAALGLGA